MSKRIKQEITPNPKGGIDVSVTCKECGEPIVKSNKFGVYCENMCGLEEDKEAHKKVKDILDGFKDMFGKK